MKDAIPYRSGSSDVGALMLAIFCAAIALLFLSRVTLYEPLRSGGETVEGRWVDGFVLPQTEQYEAIYRFELDGKIYRGRQQLTPVDYAGDGRPVAVLYLPENPKLSRVLGGEAIQAGDALGLLLSLSGVLLTLQHILAYYSKRASLVLILRRCVRRLF